MNLVFEIVIYLFVFIGISCLNFETKNVVLHSPVFAKDSNFGYSVAGYQVDGDSWILVGAPLTERERFHGKTTKNREGAVYRCRINTPNSCFMLPFDKKDWSEVRDHYGIYYSENKTDQLLGSTLLVNDDIIMTCAPNYRYVTRMLGQDEFRYEPTGTCFTLRDKMRKFEEHSPCRNSLWGHHRQGYCQAGFSAAISKNDSSLFITGPGAWYWQGMVFSINIYNKEIRHKYPSRSGEGKNDDSYRGYAIDIGHFDNDIYEDIVVSSPRANNCKGYIEIFSSDFRLLHKIEGKQIGAYFGASLIAVDLNNDFSTDIVIGSPMFKKDSENYDIGQVEIYIRDKKSNGFIFKKNVIYGFKSRSRFGSAISKLGDLNDDGYNDIAIAAPYDGDDNSGIVYIFNGNSDGLNLIPSQIIKGSDYGLKTFGFSLSGGLDLDGNKYPDLIVGAYKSNAVAFIRAKSVIKTLILTQINPRLIDFDSQENYCDKNKTKLCVDLEYCVEYYGKSVPKIMKMSINLELDIDKFENKSLIRALFNETKSYHLIKNYTFKLNTRACFRQVVVIKKNLRDKLTPIKCRLNLTLPKYETEWELLPMFGSVQDSSKIHEIRFLRNCGSDDICVPDLQVTASTPTKKFIYGSQNYIDINIHVENSKEDAFESQCHINLPYGVNYVKAFVTQSSLSQQLFLPCYQNKEWNNTKIICDIGNPMVSASSKSFTIRVAPGNLILNEKVLKFNVTVTSSNKEELITTFDNEHYVYVVLDAVPKLALIGKQYQEQVIYDSKLIQKAKKNKHGYDTEFDIGPEIMHEYKILNKGPSQFSMGEIIITWQNQIKVGTKSENFLYLMDMPYTEGPMQCNVENFLINPLNLTKLSDDKIKNPEKYYFDSKKVKRNIFTDTSDFSTNILRFFPSDFYLNPYRNRFYDDNIEMVDCHSGIVNTNPTLKNHLYHNKLKIINTELYTRFCSSIHCRINGLNADESALIRLRFRLWAKTLAKNPEIYSIKTNAMAVVTQIPYKNININLNQYQSSIKIETIAYPNERKQMLKHIDIRIIILSILAGIILLILLTIILWCFGFFRRFEPNEESKIKLSETATSDEEISSSNDVIDVAKDLTKSENENREHINLLPSIHPCKQSYAQSGTLCSLKQKQSLMGLNDYSNSIKNLNNGFTSKIVSFSSPKNEYKNLNNLIKSDEIYGFTPLNKIIKSETNLNQLSTFQVNNKSNTVFKGKITNNSSTVQKNKEEQKLIKQGNDSYTNRLPPVPRRNSKTNINNSSTTLSINNSLKNINKLNASISSNRIGSSINVSSCEAVSPIIKPYFQKL